MAHRPTRSSTGRGHGSPAWGCRPRSPRRSRSCRPCEGDRWEAFGFLTGSTAPDLGLPFTGPEACPEGPPCQWPTAVRAATLHEFAHLWLAPPKYAGRASYEFTSKQVAAFLAANDLTWHDPDLPWAQQGNERAAETLTWGLMDQPYTVDPRLGPADLRAVEHRLPDPDRCPARSPGLRRTRRRERRHPVTPTPTGHRVTRALGRALVALALVLCPACSSPPGLGSPGGPSRAEQWFAAYHDALRQGAFNVGPFYADDARIDLTTLEGPQVTGRESVLQTIGGAFVPFRNQTPEPGALYLSRMGAVEAAPIKGPAEDPNRLLAIDTFGAQGMTSQVFALSVLAWRERLQGDPRMLAVQTAAQDWATAWSSASAHGSRGPVRAHRHPHRRPDGSAHPVPRRGHGPDRPACPVRRTRPGDHRPAPRRQRPCRLRRDTPRSAPLRPDAINGHARHSDEGDRCPGHLAVVLDLDEQGRITHEQRYHRVDTLTRCVGAGPGDARIPALAGGMQSPSHQRSRRSRPAP